MSVQKISGRGRPKSITPEQEREVIKLHSEGVSYRKISELTGVSKSQVGNILKYYKPVSAASRNVQNVQKKSGQARKKARQGTAPPPVDVDEDKPPMTNNIWKGETPRLDENGDIKDWKGPKVPPDYYHWYCTFIDDPKAWDPYFAPGRIHEEIGGILDALQVGDIEQLLKARDHLKTTFIQRGHPLYHICEQTPTAHKGIILSAFDIDLVEESFNYIIGQLAENERILSFYGYLIDDENLSGYKNTRQKKRGKKRSFRTGTAFWRYQDAKAAPGLKAVSWLAKRAFTGQHPGAVYLDDIEADELTPVEMKKYKRILLKKLIPAVSKTGFLVITGTIKGYDTDTDIYLLLKSNDMYETFEYPAVTDVKTGAPSFPPWDDCEFETYWVDKINPKTGKPVINARTGKPRRTKKIRVVSIKNRPQYVVTYPEKFTLEDLVLIRRKYRFGNDATEAEFFAEYQLEPYQATGKYFDKARISWLPPRLPHAGHFSSFEDVRDYCLKYNHRIFMWLDPGGKGAGHGVAISVGTFLFGRYVFFDFVVVKEGLTAVAAKVAELLEYWAVDSWGIESNFQQKELYGEPIDERLYKYFKATGKTQIYSMPSYFDNSANKIKRIDAHVSIMLGYGADPIRFHVNPDAESKEQFDHEFVTFPDDELAKGKHEWDILDSMSSQHIHQFICGTAPVGAAGG